jgi:hypothetical protein
MSTASKSDPIVGSSCKSATFLPPPVPVPLQPLTPLDRTRLDSMKDVSESITKLNKESQLLVVRGPPTTILPALFKDWGVTDIVWYVLNTSTSTSELTLL